MRKRTIEFPVTDVNIQTIDVIDSPMDLVEWKDEPLRYVAFGSIVMTLGVLVASKSIKLQIQDLYIYSRVLQSYIGLVYTIFECNRSR